MRSLVSTRLLRAQSPPARVRWHFRRRAALAANTDNRPAPRQGSGTLIERALPRSDEAAANAVFKNLSTKEPERSAAQKREQLVLESKPDKKLILMAVGGGAAAMLLVAIVGSFLFRSGSAPAPASSSSTAASQPGPPASTQPKASPSLVSSSPSLAKPAEPKAPDRQPGKTVQAPTSQNDRALGGQRRHAGAVASTDRPEAREIPLPVPPKPAVNSATPASRPPRRPVFLRRINSTPLV